MKSHYLALITVPFLAVGACSQSGPAIVMTGNGGSGGGQQTGAGGTSGGDGGSTGSGGSSAGQGGATGQGGSSAGNGGTTGQGGSSAADGGAKGGATGTGGSMNMIDTVTGMPNTFGDMLKSSWFMFPCYSQQAQDCITVPGGGACPNQNTSLPFEMQGLSFSETFTVGGTAGTMYMMTIQVNGITEGKYYMNGTRFQTAAPADPEPTTGGLNMFYTGGTPVNVENYNVYKITVNNMAGTEIQHYYLNSAPDGTGTTYERHNSFPLSYSAQIPIMGGGTVVYFESDRNCHAIDNCGGNFAGSSTTCAVSAGRNIPMEPNVTIPTMWQGKSVASLNTRNGAAQPFHAQIVHVTVTDVSPM